MGGAWLGGTGGPIVGFVAMAMVGAIVDLPHWFGVNLAWFVLTGAVIGRRRAAASTPIAP